MTKIVNADTRELTVSRSRSRLLIAALALTVTVTASAHAGSLPLQWDAPTTNADGTALADLANYRIYLGATVPTCPSASFHLVSSPTSTPGAGEVVASRIVGLSAGTTYFARVTAVDATGNESACSTSASGMAQVDFSVTPTTSTSFGSITVGSTADRAFTVQNTSLVSLSGSVSVGAPFTILSGGAFSLAPGASHTATVRFAPTTVGSFAGNVNVTAGSDTLSRAVSGSATTAAVTLSVAKSGTGTGAVTSSPAGISCGSDCSETVTAGTQLTLTATPAPGSTFAGWSGACTGTATCTVTVNTTTSVTATFTLTPATLSVSKTGTGAGTVTSSPAGIDCGTVCTATMAPGAVVTLTAVASTGSAFMGWGDACSGTASTCTWTMSGGTAVTAVFDSTGVDRPLKLASAPVVRSLTPDRATAGSTDLMLTVKGKGFVAGSVVRWNGNGRTTTYVTTTQLRAAISAADLASPGSVAVDVVTPGGTSQALTFTITAAPASTTSLSTSALDVSTSTVSGDIVIDNADPGVQDSVGGRTFTGTWCRALTARTSYGSSSLFACGGGVDTYRWTPYIPASSVHDVYVWVAASRDLSSSVPFVVVHAAGTTMRTLDQHTGPGRWVLHGQYAFQAGTAGYAETSSEQARAEGGTAGADAVRFVRRR